MQPRPLIDWSATEATYSPDGDASRRMGWLAVLLCAPLLAVAVRLADLQGRLQSSFTAVYSQTHAEEQDLPARNGRILAADGTVLADDIVTFDLHIHYRWLEQPSDPTWLKRQAWSRLSRSERRQAANVTTEIAQIQSRQAQVWSDLALLTGHPESELKSLAQSIQDRVDQIWWSVQERRLASPAASASEEVREKEREGERATDWRQLWSRVRRELTQPPLRIAEDRLVIREQDEFHSLLTNIPTEAAAEIEAHPERYPGVRIMPRPRRVYPQGDLAVHVLGARTATTDDADRVDAHGRSGLERQYDDVLQGRRGRKRTIYNRHGEVLRTEILEPPVHGRDLVLTLDPQLQRRTEQILDAALQRVPASKPAEDEAPRDSVTVEPPRGACLVALDVYTGAVLAAACAPRFDANWLITPDPDRWKTAMADPRKPFYPRITQMSLPPGSVFKTATAIALLESGTVNAHSVIQCQGYLDRPDQYRCLTFRHYGVGHGNVDLSEALCRSCNVYFFTGARRAGPERLVEWAEKLGIGQPTGIDLPGETGGRLPSPGRAGSVGDRSPSPRWYPGDTLGLAIGQSSLTVTPLQMARLMAAVANNGFLVTPHLAAAGGPMTVDSDSAALEARPVFAHPEPTPVAGLNADTLAAIRAGLCRVVHDPHGTAYHTVKLSEVAIAGKTGTAEVGGGQPDHAWFAGYVPADRPRIAFAVVLEHGGSGGKVAGPVAREFVKSLLEAGVVSAEANVAESRRER